MSIPHLFRCPISLDIFTDPVTLCTGQTYDRPCIERWLAAGHRTCPVTMQPLGDATALVPNRTLRHLIERWLSTDQHHNHHLPEPAAPAAEAEADAEEPSLAALKRCLQQPDAAGAGKAKVGALKKVMTLASESDVGRACMVQLGFLPVLLQLVFHAPAAPPSERRGGEAAVVEELALQCALGLMPSSAASPQLGCLNVLKSEASLASLVALLERGRGRTRAGLVPPPRGAPPAPAARRPCAHARCRRTSAHAASDAAVRAVAAIWASEPARGGAIHHGAVGALLGHLSWAASGKCASGGCAGAVPSALAAVEALAASEAGRMAVARAPGGTRALVRHVFMMNSSNDGSEHAVAALLAVCRESRAARSEAAGAGVVTLLLLLLQSQCGARAKAKARSLLKLLKSM
ncbi:hypothetical protein OsI_15987 [Oryza sativa Indica Group]|uniref:U-box domain-containing protein n=1 Tax=Oryza sativa subsp. indica TaxID=39946 RepID=B8AU19_ORYSI|nr:hypothetical protein OsI_15987 [Oryza sativa Indica Group]